MANKSQTTEKDLMSIANKSFLETSANKKTEKMDRCFSIPDIQVILADETPSLKTVRKKLSGEQTTKPKLHRCNALSDAELAQKFLADNLTSEQISKQNLLHVFLQSFTTDPESSGAFISGSYRCCRSLPDLVDCTSETYNSSDNTLKEDSACNFLQQTFNSRPLAQNRNFLSVDSILDEDDVFEFSSRSSRSKNSLMALCASNPSSLSSESDDLNEANAENSDFLPFVGDRHEVPEKVGNSSHLLRFEDHGRVLKRCFSLGATE